MQVIETFETAACEGLEMFSVGDRVDAIVCLLNFQLETEW